MAASGPAIGFESREAKSRLRSEFWKAALSLDETRIRAAKVVGLTPMRAGGLSRRRLRNLISMDRRVFYPETAFGGFTNVDGTIQFYLRVNALLDPGHVVLEIGAGRGRYAGDRIALRRNLRIFKGRCRKVIGIDVDPEARENPYLDEFRLIEGDRWPIAEDSVDLAICDSVLEHVENPELFFQEAQRVTRPGGFICLRTPNVFSYFGLASVLVPARWHFKVLTRVQPNPIEEADVFPTVYRCNTRRKLRGMLSRHGFDGCVYGYDGEPSYLSFSRIAYALGFLHNKLAPGVLKVTLMAFGRKRQLNSVQRPQALPCADVDSNGKGADVVPAGQVAVKAPG
jgi:SAM-dependent methyltransferase